MRIVFFGSPDFAVSSLAALVEAGHEVALVVTQPAKPVGRKATLTDPAVARKAKELGLPVSQPSTLKDDAVVARLAEAKADLFVVVAYGKILPQRVLDLPRLGCVNVHGSLLPRWRGASPVQAALLAGDEETGVSIMKMDAGMDTGPVYAGEKTKIGEGEAAGELSKRLAKIGAALLVQTLRFLEGKREDVVHPVPQDNSLATYCPKIHREDGRVDWRRPAREIVRKARAYTPWPSLFTFRRKTRVKLLHVALAVHTGARARPGTLLEAASPSSPSLVVACGEGAVEVVTLQAEGRRALPAAEFVRGEHVEAGEIWGE